MGIFDPKPNRTEVKPETANLSIDDQITEALRRVYDPEIPINIYEMGLIYRVDRNPDTNDVKVEMTLTSPNCPAAQELPLEVKHGVESVPGINEAEVEIVWDPPWGPEQMSEEAKMELGIL